MQKRQVGSAIIWSIGLLFLALFLLVGFLSGEWKRGILIFVCISVLLAPFTVALALYGILRQYCSRRVALVAYYVSASVAMSVFLIIAFIDLSYSSLIGSFVLPPTVAGLVAGWLALRTKRTILAFLIGLVLAPIVAVLTILAIRLVSELYILPMAVGEPEGLSLDFATFIPMMFYLTIGWPIVAIVAAGVCIVLVRKRRRKESAARCDGRTCRQVETSRQ